MDELSFNAEEQELLRKANEIRKEAKDRRRLRIEASEKAWQERRTKAAEERKEKEAEEARVRKLDGEKRRKAARDADITAMLLPLAKQMQMNGFRIKREYRGVMPQPVFTLRRTNVIPTEEVKIYWKEGNFGQLGFYWE